MKRKVLQRVIVNNPKTKKICFELKRKSVHIFIGSLIAFLISKNWFFLPLWIFILVLGMFASFFIKKGGKIPIFQEFILSFERKEEKKNFPLRGALFFVAGCILSHIIFDSQIAVAAIITLIVGDTIAALYGLSLGKVKSPTNSQKHLDAAFVAATANTFFLSFLLSFPLGIIFLASITAFFSESLIPFEKMEKGILGLIINDNILIPLIFGLVLFFV